MRLLPVLLLILSLACSTTPDADARALPRPSPKASPAREYGSEFAEAGAGAGSSLRFAAAPVSRAAAADPSASKPPVDSRTPVDDAAHPAKREVVYTAYLRVIVVAVEDAMRSVKTLAEQAGGYLEHSSARSIRIRIPADRFDGTIEGIESLGEVIDRAITASDVTEEVLDLNIRLDNARKTRDRLLAHLLVSKKIADTLEIEAEISRVSETIEQLEGKLRTVRSQISMSTISVDWSAQSPQPTATTAPLALPFAWIEELGDGLVAGQVEPTTRKPRLLESKLRFEPPPDFIRYYASPDRVEALSADGLRIKVREQPNHDAGALAFWKDLAREGLVRTRGLAVAEERALGSERTLLLGTREIGKQKLGYMLVLARTKRAIYSYEAWGPEEVFRAHAAALEASALTLRR